MSARVKVLWGALLFLHLSLIISASLQDIASGLGEGKSILPEWTKPLWHETAAISSALLGRRLPESNLLRQALTTYTDCTGIEAGYSYFAPSVSGNCRLVFELSYPDGHVEEELPLVAGEAAGFRIATLLDRLQAIHYVRLREEILRNLVYSVWREHRDATRISAVFGVAERASAGEYRAGKETSYHVLYAYEFRFPTRIGPPFP
ncbi:MAG: hypothetical protein H0X40_05135 [Chthoniobacterales bacterium]|nr:hypothetical protein [Chthoniobacterales bacterium]